MQEEISKWFGGVLFKLWENYELILLAISERLLDYKISIISKTDWLESILYDSVIPIYIKT